MKKKVLQTIGIVFIVLNSLFISSTLFFNLIVGAPDAGDGLKRYMFLAAIMSLLLPAFGCYNLVQNWRLQNIIKEYHRQESLKEEPTEISGKRIGMDKGLDGDIYDFVTTFAQKKMLTEDETNELLKYLEEL